MSTAVERKTPPPSDRRQWQRIFGGLVELLHSQQSQIETLSADSDSLLRAVQAQQTRWSACLRLYDTRLGQVMEEEKKSRHLKEKLMALLVALKDAEISFYKSNSELCESDIDEFRVCVEDLVSEIIELKEKLSRAEKDKKDSSDSDPSTSKIEEGSNVKELRSKLQKLKQAYRKLRTELDSKISALLAEKDFVWNQLDAKDEVIRVKRLELAQANKAVENLRCSVDELQKSGINKEELISRLKEEKARLESENRKKILEAEAMKQDLNLLDHKLKELQMLDKEKDDKNFGRKTRSSNDSSLKRELSNVAATSSRRRARCTTSRKNGVSRPRKDNCNAVAASAELDASQKRKRSQRDAAPTPSALHSLQRYSARLRSRTSPLPLFSSGFKVPKLKITSPASLPGN